MARKAPGKGARKAKAAPAPKRKRMVGSSPTTRSQPRAAPARKRAGPTAYEKRLAEYQRTHPGWRHDPHWKQKARGHKEAEHVGRAARLRERVDALIERQVRRWPGVDQVKLAADISRKLWAKIRAEGEGVVRGVEALVAKMEGERAEQPKDARGRPLPLPWVNMKTLEDEWELPREIFGYH